MIIFACISISRFFFFYARADDFDSRCRPCRRDYADCRQISSIDVAEPIFDADESFRFLISSLRDFRR